MILPYEGGGVMVIELTKCEGEEFESSHLQSRPLHWWLNSPN